MLKYKIQILIPLKKVVKFVKYLLMLRSRRILKRIIVQLDLGLS